MHIPSVKRKKIARKKSVAIIYEVTLVFKALLISIASKIRDQTREELTLFPRSILVRRDENLDLSARHN